MFKNIFESLVFCVHFKVLIPKGNATIFLLITKIYVEIDNLVPFALFLLFQMLMRYNVKQFKVTEYVMSHTIIIYQLSAYAKYSYKNKFCNTTLVYCTPFDYEKSALQFLNVCPFDYTAVAGSGKVDPLTRLTTPVGWL